MANPVIAIGLDAADPNLVDKWKEYWEILDQVYEHTANQLLDLMLDFLDHPPDYEQLSYQALARAKKMHNPTVRDAYLDQVYDEALS
jgi:hypothetical protein